MGPCSRSVLITFTVKHRYQCFIAESNICTSSGAYELKQKCTSALVTHTRTSTDILFCDKTLVSMFNCKSNKHGPRAQTHLLTDKLYADRCLLCA